LKRWIRQIIDEISMVRADVLDAIDYVMRKTLKKSEPFGGKQLLLVGDNFQLEPVVRQERIGNIRSEYYPHPYYFASHAFKQLECQIIELKTIYRQTDEYFIKLLNNIRIGAIHLDDLEALNSRFTSR